MSLEAVVPGYLSDVRLCLRNLWLIRQVAQNCCDAIPSNENRQSLLDAIMKHERVQAILDVHEGIK